MEIGDGNGAWFVERPVASLRALVRSGDKMTFQCHASVTAGPPRILHSFLTKDRTYLAQQTFVLPCLFYPRFTPLKGFLSSIRHSVVRSLTTR